MSCNGASSWDGAAAGALPPAGAVLQLSDGAGQQKSVEFTADGVWRRYALSTAWTVAVDTGVFTVSTPLGAAVDIYGAQLEAQPASSAYKKTFDRGGVHPAARFASDVLGDRAAGVGEHASVIRISWTPLQI